MAATIIDGRAIAAKIRAKLTKSIEERAQKGLKPPSLKVILIGEDPASEIYVRHKQNACKEVGIISNVEQLKEQTSQAKLEQLIDETNNDSEINGILLQLPLPAHIVTNELLEKIDPLKDVDGFHPYNLGRLAQRRPQLRPCTPAGIMQMLDILNIDLTGKHAVILGASNIVGQPMCLELLAAKCTVTICHSFTQDLAQHVQTADILISATGKPGVVQSTWIKPKSIVIDVGISRGVGGNIFGDIEFETAAQRAAYITPVPGGVGPLTVATLLQNTLLAAKLQGY